MRYLVVMHKTGTGYSASAPDVPGCVAADSTLQKTETLFREALTLHLKSDSPPKPNARAIEVDGYNVVVEKIENGYKAAAQDLEGFTAAGDTLERAEALIREVIAWHLTDLRLFDEPPPERISEIIYVDIDLPVRA